MRARQTFLADRHEFNAGLKTVWHKFTQFDDGESADITFCHFVSYIIFAYLKYKNLKFHTYQYSC